MSVLSETGSARTSPLPKGRLEDLSEDEREVLRKYWREKAREQRANKDVPDVPVPSRGWAERAACLGLPTEMFFPERGVRPEEVLELCRRCPVRVECADLGLRCQESQFDYGIWGGTTSRDRRGFRSEWRGPRRFKWSLADVAEMIQQADCRRGVGASQNGTGTFREQHLSKSAPSVGMAV